jgi:hypothetical protein
VTYADVYVGRLGEGADPLDWGGDWNGNTPSRLSPFFPSSGGRAFSMLTDKVDSGQLPGKRVDWGAWAANVSKQQILDFFVEVYPPEAAELSSGDSASRRTEVWNFLTDLPDGRYALVASEL